MNRNKALRPLNPQIREEATAWFVAFCEEEVDVRAREEFNAWLRTSPEHVRAYLRISAFWEDAELFGKCKQRGVEEIVRRALSETNVVPLGDVMMLPTASAWARRLRGRYYAIAASAVLMCAGVGFVVWSALFRAPTYVTGLGEQRSITLPDGSTVSLNARSKLKVRYTDAARDVDLVSGQALFRVAKNTTRPFIVHSDDTSVRAVGTQFDVYRKRDATVVTVVEGRVLVSGADGEGAKPPSPSLQTRESTARDPVSSHLVKSVVVSAGERVIATADALAAPHQTNAAAATAWTEGKLVFDAAPLSEVIEEFNRYTVKRLVIDDAGLRNTHISGAFSVTDSQQFVEFLHQRFGVVSHETDDEVRIAR
ncbi:MAG: FecR domain-containing protein [Gammaproteobacteria bacterium]